MLAVLTDPFVWRRYRPRPSPSLMAGDHVLAALSQEIFHDHQTTIEQEINSQLGASRLSALFYTSPKFFSHLFAARHKCCVVL